MKPKNKVLWVFAGGILLVLLLFLGQQFFQTRKKQIAVILSENAVYHTHSGALGKRMGRIAVCTKKAGL